MTRYTSVTDADLSEMLGTIGVGSIEELFADIPAGLRLDRPLALGAGLSEQEVYEELRALAARNTSAEDEVSFLGAGHVRPLRPGADRLDHPALGVPDAVHALPARDLPGRAAGDVRVPDRDLRADRAAGLERVGVRGPERGRRGRVRRQGRQRPRTVRDLARGAPALARTLRTLAHGWEMEVVEAPLRNGATDAARARRRRQRGDRAAAELPRRGRGPDARWPTRRSKPARCASAPATRCRSRC